jgi:hypothetical protein
MLPSQMVALDEVATVLPPEWLALDVPDPDVPDPDVVEEPVPEPCEPQPSTTDSSENMTAAVRAMQDGVVMVVCPVLPRARCSRCRARR